MIRQISSSSDAAIKRFTTKTSDTHPGNFRPFSRVQPLSDSVTYAAFVWQLALVGVKGGKGKEMPFIRFLAHALNTTRPTVNWYQPSIFCTSHTRPFSIAPRDKHTSDLANRSLSSASMLYCRRVTQDESRAARALIFFHCNNYSFISLCALFPHWGEICRYCYNVTKKIRWSLTGSPFFSVNKLSDNARKVMKECSFLQKKIELERSFLLWAKSYSTERKGALWLC